MRRSLVFILDRSGSMDGDPMNFAKVGALLGSLACKAWPRLNCPHRALGSSAHVRGGPGAQAQATPIRPVFVAVWLQDACVLSTTHPLGMSVETHACTVDVCHTQSAISWAIQSLTPQDEFNIVAYDHEQLWFGQGLVREYASQRQDKYSQHHNCSSLLLPVATHLRCGPRLMLWHLLLHGWLLWRHVA